MSQVYFSDMRIERAGSMEAKVLKLIRAAGLTKELVEGKYVALKTTFGEYGNATYLKPFYVRTIAKEVERLGGHPFVTDCCTLYYGMRSNGLEHLRCAALNGFSYDSCGCEIIIADGVRGSDDVDIPVPEGGVLKVAHVGRALMDADVVISITHAKGCIASGLGGTLKNLSMGCASRAGKMAMHREGAPKVDQEVCIGCRLCLRSCGSAAISFNETGKAVIMEDACVGCAHCISFCPHRAITAKSPSKFTDLQTRMAEYAAAFQAAQNCLHFAVATDITPGCDCFADNDSPMVPDIGMFASLDPVALDQAVADAICAQEPLPAGPLPELQAAYQQRFPEEQAQPASGPDNLLAVNPDSDWKICVKHAEELGAGTRDYTLVKVGCHQHEVCLK